MSPKLLIAFAVVFVRQYCFAQEFPIGTLDRKSVVRRHDLHITNVHEPGPTQVGNGNFAYGFDITGMQTFHGEFATMSQWSWHSMPLPTGVRAADFKRTAVKTGNRMVAYNLPNADQPELSDWLSRNPHRFNLGRIGLWLKKKDGAYCTDRDISHADQTFDLWTAVGDSHFELQGQAVHVITVADPAKDLVAFRIESPLIAAGRLGVFIDFPYANPEEDCACDYTKAALHSTELSLQGNRRVRFSRIMDSTRYEVAATWSGTGKVQEERKHRYRFIPAGGDAIEYVFCFSPEAIPHELPGFSEVLAHSGQAWPAFWRTGGAIDLSGSKDVRWKELERRIVLSQYDMKINASGKYPPQETGLVGDSWYGRWHYEMIWWHIAHYALWNRWSLLNNSLHVYRDNLVQARQLAALQGYAGARYPKCTGPDGREWPHPIHAFLVWQQPHPLFFANLDYRAHPTKATLDKWADIVDASGDFLATYATRDSLTGQYDLGTPISFVPENNDFYKDRNPAFELGYWRFGLRIAQDWRLRSGLGRKPLWDTVYHRLAPLPEKDGLYEQWEHVSDMWTRFNFEHPALLGTYGMLSGDGVDTTVMRRTLEKVLGVWQFERCWGWDFPLMAMTAARLGEPEKAIELLLNPAHKNNYDLHGFVGGGNPYPYFPANGGLLYAVAMMAAGWDGDGGCRQPGFPQDGQWVVKWEGLAKAP